MGADDGYARIAGVWQYARYEARKVQSSQPIAPTRLVLDPDHIRQYDRNPRRERNPFSHEIKDSIRARGLGQPLPVTRRPGEEHYAGRCESIDIGRG